MVKPPDGRKVFPDTTFGEDIVRRVKRSEPVAAGAAHRMHRNTHPHLYQGLK